jgi:hypothetical protein
MGGRVVGHGALYMCEVDGLCCGILSFGEFETIKDPSFFKISLI